LLEPPTGRRAPSALQSVRVPDLAARRAAPVRRNVYGLACRCDIQWVAERAGLGRDCCFRGSRRLSVHEARLLALRILS